VPKAKIKDYEAEMCLHCLLPVCKQTVKSGCLLKDEDSDERKELFLFIKRHPRHINDINDKFGEKFTVDNIILLSGCDLVRYQKGLWCA